MQRVLKQVNQSTARPTVPLNFSHIEELLEKSFAPNQSTETLMANWPHVAENVFDNGSHTAGQAIYGLAGADPIDPNATYIHVLTQFIRKDPNVPMTVTAKLELIRGDGITKEPKTAADDDPQQAAIFLKDVYQHLHDVLISGGAILIEDIGLNGRTREIEVGTMRLNRYYVINGLDIRLLAIWGYDGKKSVDVSMDLMTQKLYNPKASFLTQEALAKNGMDPIEIPVREFIPYASRVKN